MSFLSKLLSSEVIEIRAGRARSIKGVHSDSMLSEISDVCKDTGIVKGEVCLSGDGTIRFYGGIPSEKQQALRNVIGEYR